MKEDGRSFFLLSLGVEKSSFSERVAKLTTEGEAKPEKPVVAAVGGFNAIGLEKEDPNMGTWDVGV